ncbi:PREDICTED: PX domain-containing protein kinase-like protein isoform X2 [Priapulus caudatus]|uniref:PX domain-containing protein kinase-like protein isoform X2 n=1 Tax=Priapulus caudatus TaxID=37621 RepID=A0ABM1EHU6_PRICU|nr:PREDICTED: PX domain-containing protein kinase-like protein isoform X2 [Priapulus caudatus]XP_014671767.1 PREDICTED: PX domain-containing protein kinase-like protein isoform X2 [Priapulus caudatus]
MMDILEKPPAGHVLDDTQPLSCIIEAAQTVQGHTDYVIKVQRGPIPENCWRVTRRYSDFASLNATLQTYSIDLSLPSKKVFGNLDREFVAERQQGLQSYLDALAGHLMVSSNILVKKFLDPESYAINYQESALQHVSMFFRSEPKWEMSEVQQDIGWRIKKQYFMVKHVDRPKHRQLLTWASLGPDNFLSTKDLDSIMRLLPSLKHPFILPITFAMANENGGLAIRTYISEGTLRDRVYKTRPRQPYLKKYGKPKSVTPLPQNEIKTFGRQILEALKFLHDKGLPYGHLHAGNVIIDNGSCKLLDVENHLLGLPGFYRSYITLLKRASSTEAIDVYCFGHVLYEMAVGTPLASATCDSLPSCCSPQVRSVLEMVLTSEALRTGLPDVATLIAQPLFSDVPVSYLEKPQMKVSSRLREAIQKSKEAMETRLKEEKKAITQHKRISKAQAKHMSEEEKKKRKKKALSAARIAQNSSSEQVNGGVSGDSSSSRSTTPQMAGMKT